MSTREMTHEELKLAYMKMTQRVQELEEDYEYLSHHYGLETEQNKRYREALEEILENEISCWEIIKNKLTHALYK